MKPTYVYVIRSLVRSYIDVGMSDNVERRLKQHNNGENKSTKPYKSFQLILVEEFPSRIEARKREKFLKAGSGKKYLKSL
jgi:putative endonuclease